MIESVPLDSPSSFSVDKGKGTKRVTLIRRTEALNKRLYQLRRSPSAGGESLNSEAAQLQKSKRRNRSHASSPVIDESLRTEPTELEKIVRFSRNVRKRYTMSVAHHYTKEEMRACWFSSEECIKITKQCAKQIKIMEQGEPLLQKKYCERGLEGHTRLGSKLKYMNRTETINRVLEEQDRQRIEGVVDDEALARACRSVTASSQLWARSIGLRDQREAEACSLDYDEPNTLPKSDVTEESSIADEEQYQSFKPGIISPVLVRHKLDLSA